MRSFLSQLFTRTGSIPGERTRDRGRPPSPNGASSLHLRWQVPGPASAVRVTLEVTEPPQTPDLYFFALQATFAGDGADSGGAHVGLQWNTRHRGATAVNWGGYRSQASGGSVLEGTTSPLPSLPNDPNTRDYSWQPYRPYQLAIEPGSRPGWWAGSVTDLHSGVRTVIRELNGGGNALASPMVWAEVFAPCDAPPVAIRWTALEVAREGGSWQSIRVVETNYQSHRAGGCSNTNSHVAGDSFVQRTNAERTSAPGQMLVVDAGDQKWQ